MHICQFTCPYGIQFIRFSLYRGFILRFAHYSIQHETIFSYRDTLHNKIREKCQICRNFSTCTYLKLTKKKKAAAFILLTCKYGNKHELRTKQLLPSSSLTFASLIVPKVLTANQNIPICTSKSGDINIHICLFIYVLVRNIFNHLQPMARQTFYRGIQRELQNVSAQMEY